MGESYRDAPDFQFGVRRPDKLAFPIPHIDFRYPVLPEHP